MPHVRSSRAADSDVEREVKTAGITRTEMRALPRSKDLKYRIICAGVTSLMEKKKLREEDIMLWLDWQSIHQDDEAMKLKGVESLIKYTTLCEYMLIPTEEEDYPGR